MSEKKKVLVFTRYYLPGFKAGGPIRSISNMIINLSDTYEFYIVTTDRDSFETSSYSNIEKDTWTQVGTANVYYVSPSNRKIAVYRRILADTRFSIIYLNSFFDVEFSFRPLLVTKFQLRSSAKVVVAPRGEFSEGALELKRMKKRLFLKAFRCLGLPKKVMWQATSEGEVSDIQTTLGSKGLQIFLAPNFSDSVLSKTDDVSFEGTIKIIYLSRISPKKNLDFALHILKGLDLKVKFDIYGLVDDDGYWEQCQKTIESMPTNVSVNYYGPIPHNEVKQKMGEYHLFFLPTKGENYGHTIVEALSCGLPVLISDQTPWLNLVDFGVGWDISLTEPTEFQNALVNYYMSLRDNRPYDKKHVIQYITKQTDSGPIKKAYLELFS